MPSITCSSYTNKGNRAPQWLHIIQIYPIQVQYHSNMSLLAQYRASFIQLGLYIHLMISNIPWVILLASLHYDTPSSIEEVYHTIMCLSPSWDISRYCLILGNHSFGIINRKIVSSWDISRDCLILADLTKWSSITHLGTSTHLRDIPLSSLIIILPHFSRIINRATIPLPYLKWLN